MKLESVINRAKQYRADRSLQSQIQAVEGFLSTIPTREASPVLFFNASTRIHRLSLNGAYSLLASWGLRANGTPVRYLVCHAGMEQCVLGATLDDPLSAPPCRTCMRFSSYLLPGHLTLYLEKNDVKVQKIHDELKSLDLDGLKAWECAGLPLGELILPGLQWSLRRADLKDDERTRSLFVKFLASAASLQEHFSQTLDELRPLAVVVFNGIFYPEAILREIAVRRDIPVVTHEVGLQPYSAFFTHEHATFRKVEVPEGFKLNEEQSRRLDRYLEDRFEGRFSMAGVRFWPEIVDLPDEIESAIASFEQTAVAFTNVIFDTSQVHANAYFEDMFSWLSYLEKVIDDHPETLFILRAHPDEDRPGKSSQQSVSAWVQSSGLEHRKNVFFIEPSEYVSSYELIRRAKFVLVYNSSIGIEATILGAPVLMAGRARYSHENTAFIPKDRDEYVALLRKFLAQDKIEVPEGMIAAAQRLLYLELFHASLDLSRYLSPDPVLPGMVTFKEFDPEDLQHDPVLETVRCGVLEAGDFRLPQDR
ncbi:MAG: hypothetical protein PVF18_09980 [Anaerolineales bacterium]